MIYTNETDRRSRCPECGDPILPGASHECDVYIFERERDAAHASEAMLREALEKSPCTCPTKPIPVCPICGGALTGTERRPHDFFCVNCPDPGCEPGSCHRHWHENELLHETVGKCARCAALSTPADDWLARRDAEKDAQIAYLQGELHVAANAYSDQLAAAEAARDSYKALADAGTAACAEVDARCKGLVAERDGLAAALYVTNGAFERFASANGPTCSIHDYTDEVAPGECNLCDIDRGARCITDPSSHLARITAEARKQALADVYGRIRGLRGCGGFDVIDTVQEMVQEADHEAL